MSGFFLIEDRVLAAPASSVVFNTGLNDFTRFHLTVFAVKDGTDGRPLIRLNGDSAGNYIYQDITADGSTVDGARTGANQTAYSLCTDNDMDGGSSGLFTVDIQKPLATLPARIQSESSYMQATGPAINYEAIVGQWTNTGSLISSITVLLLADGNFAAGTRLLLEGA